MTEGRRAGMVGGGGCASDFRFGEVPLFTFLAFKFNLFFPYSFLCITMSDVSFRIQEEDFKMGVNAMKN